MAHFGVCILRLHNIRDCKTHVSIQPMTLYCILKVSQ